MLAVLYDVHGNLEALEAVLAEARAAGARRWLVGGDVAAFGGWPAECAARLRGLEGAQCIRGNTERWLADDSELARDAPQVAALAAAREALGAGAVARLAALPERLALAEGHFSHASPLSDMESFAPEPQPGEERLLAGVSAPRVFFGHTHVQFARRREDGTELVNPGSVGMPFDGDRRAAWALVGAGGELELRRTAYDAGAAAARLRERWPGAAWARLFAGRLETARP